MRLPGRLSAAIEVLADMEARKRPAAEALKDWGLSHRFAGAGDRAAIGNLVYDALRKKASHGYAMGEDTARALVLSVAVRDWGESLKALEASFGGDEHAPAALTEDERSRLLAENPLAGAPDHVRADVPEWTVPHLQASFGEAWVAEGQGMTGRPPLDMRVNSLKSDTERVTRSLKRFDPQPTGGARLGLRLAAGHRDSRTPNVQTDEAFLKGWFEIQDEGSQLVAAVAGAKAGDQVLDFCAGGGGKSLAMAAAMGNKGQIFAHDSDRNRLAPIYDRLKRNGARNVQVRPPGPMDDLVGRMDRVVVDAPCTGTGTWRRRPDTKWKLTEAQLASRTEEQRAILADAARFVKPGGLLAYITCSILAEENAGSVEAFLAANAGFGRLDAGAEWARAALQGAPEPYSAEGMLTLTPARNGTDGFFIALLRRTT